LIQVRLLAWQQRELSDDSAEDGGKNQLLPGRLQVQPEAE